MGHLCLFEFVFRCRSPFSSHLLLLTFLCWGVRFVPQHFLLILLVLKRRLVWVVLGIWKLSILLSTPNIREIWGFNSNLEPPTHNPHINGQICNILVLILAQFRQNKKLSSLCRFVFKVAFECFRWRFIFHFVLCLSPPPLNDSCHKLSTSISSYCAGIVSHTFIPLYASYSFYYWYDMIYLYIFGKGGEKQVC